MTTNSGATHRRPLLYDIFHHLSRRSPDPGETAGTAIDILQPGAVLEGAFRREPYTLPCRIVVQRRTGGEFTARLYIELSDGSAQADARGTVRGAEVRMESTRVSGNISPRADYEARLDGGTLTGVCKRGTGPASTFTLVLCRSGVPADRVAAAVTRRGGTP